MTVAGSLSAFIAECRRRRIFQVAGLYIVGAWVVLQVAALAFENWGIPTEAMRYVWIGAVLGFPIALVLGWRFDISGGRVVRTGDTATQPLRRGDHLVLGIASLAAFAITGAIIASIVKTSPSTPATEAARDLDPRSIAVLPFDDLSPGSDQAYFSEGIAEELLHLLARYKDLRVTSRTSASKVHEAGLSIPEIATELGVAWVLEGSVRRNEDTVRITAQLIDAPTDTHVWSETDDYEIDDIFAVYDQVAAQIARELKATVGDAGLAADTTDAETYDLYLQARRLLANRGRVLGNVAQAIELFERVTTRDPSFAPGYAGLAQARFWSPQEYPDRVRDDARRALELDPDNTEALALLGRNLVDRRKFAEGREYLERAIEIDPNNALAYRWLGQSYVSSDPSRYVAMAQQAYDRDPLEFSIHYHQTESLRIVGRTEEALAAAKSRLRYDPEDHLAWPLAAGVHASAGRLDLALKSYYKAYRAHADTAYYELVSRELVRLGRPDLADAWLEEIEWRSGVSDWTMAFVSLRRGDPEKAVQLVRDNVERGRYPLTSLAFIMMRAGIDYDEVRPILEESLRQSGKEPLEYNPEIPWVHYIDYAAILYDAGEKEAADKLVRDMRTHFDRQIDAGIRFNGFADNLNQLYAGLLVVSGEVDAAFEYLETAILRDGVSCRACFGDKVFDRIRDDPRFLTILDEMDSRIATQRQRLEDEGMLLTPEEVMALEEFDFDPFAN